MRWLVVVAMMAGCGGKEPEPRPPTPVVSEPVAAAQAIDAAPSAGPQPGADYEYQPIDAAPSADADMGDTGPCDRADALADASASGFAVVLVLDRSGSMSGAKLTAAKTGARAVVDTLDAADSIAVVGFDSQPITIVKLQKASKPKRIATDIARLQAGGGTNIYPALLEAYQMLDKLTVAGKHLVVLSDGLAPYDGIQDVADEMYGRGITISTIGIGDADRNLLRLISGSGRGCFYWTDNFDELSRVMTEDVESVRAAKQAALDKDRGDTKNKNKRRKRRRKR